MVDVLIVDFSLPVIGEPSMRDTFRSVCDNQKLRVPREQPIGDTEMSLYRRQMKPSKYDRDIGFVALKNDDPTTTAVLLARQIEKLHASFVIVIGDCRPLASKEEAQCGQVVLAREIMEAAPGGNRYDFAASTVAFETFSQRIVREVREFLYEPVSIGISSGPDAESQQPRWTSSSLLGAGKFLYAEASQSGLGATRCAMLLHAPDKQTETAKYENIRRKVCLSVLRLVELADEFHWLD